MNDRSPAELSIETSLAKGMELHEFTHWSSHQIQSNRFLRNFDVKFQEPAKHQAIYSVESYTPEKYWFCLFEDAEKDKMEDEFAFYGIRYQTKVESALRRLKRIIEKVEGKVRDKTIPNSKDPIDSNEGRIFYHRDQLKEMESGLEHFDKNDKITLTFVFSEWPNIDQAKRRNYVEEFEERIVRNTRDGGFDDRYVQLNIRHSIFF